MKPLCVIAICILLLGAAIFIYIFNPEKFDIYPRCPFYSITGLYCPGCGSLRALHSIAHGNPARAIRFNVLMVISIPLIVGLLIYKILRKQDMVNPIFSYTILAVIIIYWISRNLPIYPFTFLAPH
jgi:hypothetical protein